MRTIGECLADIFILRNYRLLSPGSARVIRVVHDGVAVVGDAFGHASFALIEGIGELLHLRSQIVQVNCHVVVPIRPLDKKEWYLVALAHPNASLDGVGVALKMKARLFLRCCENTTFVLNTLVLLVNQ